MSLRPPMSSDSEDDDYEGFSFGNEFEKPKKTDRTSSLSSHRQIEEDRSNEVMQNVAKGDLDAIKQDLLNRFGHENRINYNCDLRDGWTLMLHAVSNLHIHVVSYLIDKGADVNCHADLITPLMVICKREAFPDEMDAVLDMTKLLLKKGAVVNIRDRTGYTPFMYACTYGNKEIVQMLLDSSAIAIDAVDNNGSTALHYAVQSKHIEIVKMLISAGADIEMSNLYGRTPRDMAVELDLADIEELFPVEIIDTIPLGSEQYQTYQDLAPMIFPDHDQAEYSQDIPKMLRGMRAEICGMQFYNSKVSLAEFLTIDDNRLQSIGIDFEYQRKRILQGLLKFHRHPYSPNSIEMVSKTQCKNMYDYYEMYANYLKHLIMMKSAITYVLKIGGVKNVHQGTLQEILASLGDIQKDVALLEKYIQQLSTFSTSDPLYICSKKPNQKYKRMIGPFLKCVLGVCLFLSYKLYS